MKIGILEFGSNDNLSGADILNEVMEYARCADINGFSRFWLTEHHSPNLGWNNPEMLLPVLAAITGQIKIGLAGSLVAVHSPYRVACSFKLLSTLYSERIDLGFASGRPSVQTARYLLNQKNITDKIYDRFNDNIKSIWQFLNGTDKATISPNSEDIPQMWLLGSSYKSLSLAREMKMGYSRSLFHNNNKVSENIDLLFQHKELFFAEHAFTPPLNLAFSGLCDADSQNARKRFYDMYKFEYNEHGNSIVGSPAYFADRLGLLKEETDVDEFIFKDLDKDNFHRLRSLSLLSHLIGK